MPLPISITELPFGPEILRIELVEFRNTPMFSARKYFKNKAGQWQPGKMEIEFALGRLPDVVADFKVHSIELAKNNYCRERGQTKSK